VTRGGAGFLAITADIAPGREAAVRAAIDSELQRLAAAASDTMAFYRDRDLLARRIRLENAAPGALLAWAADRFASALPRGDMPDLGGYYATVGPDSIGALAARLFRDDNLALYMSRPLPVPLPLAAVVAILPVLLAARIFRRAALRPADMSRIRYVARLRPAMTASLVMAAAAGLAGLVAARLAVAIAHHAYARWVAPLDSLLVHAGLAGAAILAATLVLLLVVGAVPRKVLVFDDEVRLKSATFRSIILPAGDIVAVRNGRPGPGARRRAPFLPLSGTGVTLEVADGSTWFLPVRDPAALTAAVAALMTGGPVRTRLAPVATESAQEQAWDWDIGSTPDDSLAPSLPPPA